jgi:hypothetical protein
MKNSLQKKNKAWLAPNKQKPQAGEGFFIILFFKW